MGAVASRERALGLALSWHPWVFAAFALALNLRLRFQESHNDFWDTYFIARTIAAADKHTWFNPQYPIGYCLFLKGVMGTGHPSIPAMLANLGFAVAALTAARSLYRKILPAGAALFSLLALSLFPQFFRYANAGGGDPGALAFFTLGATLLLTFFLEPLRAPGRGLCFSAGLCLGVAALFRYHALVADGMLLLALFVVFTHHWKPLLFCAAGVVAAYLPQLTVNFLTGHGPLETQFGPMNVYDLMYGLNWHRITELHLPAHALQLVARDPGLFLSHYAVALWSFKQAWMPPLIAVALDRDPARKRVVRALAIWTSLYFLFFSATTSGRQILLPLPFAILALGLCLKLILDRVAALPDWRRRAAVAAMAFTCLLFLSLQVRRDFVLTRERAYARDAFTAIETRLRQGGCSRSREVFTSDFDLYFRALPPFIPYFNGGGPRLGTYRYNQEFPEFPVDDAGAFVAACRSRGVRYVVLDSGSRDLSPALGAIYASADGEAAAGLRRDLVTGTRVIFQVMPIAAVAIPAKHL